MNSKIKTFTVRSEDGSVTDELPIGANAEDIDLRSGENLQTVLGDISIVKGSVEERLSAIEMTDYVEFDISPGFNQDVEIDEAGLYIANVRNGEKILFVSAKAAREVASSNSSYIVEVRFFNGTATFSTSRAAGVTVKLKKLM